MGRTNLNDSVAFALDRLAPFSVSSFFSFSLVSSFLLPFSHFLFLLRFLSLASFPSSLHHPIPHFPPLFSSTFSLSFPSFFPSSSYLPLPCSLLFIFQSPTSLLSSHPPFSPSPFPLVPLSVHSKSLTNEGTKTVLRAECPQGFVRMHLCVHADECVGSVCFEHTVSPHFLLLLPLLSTSPSVLLPPLPPPTSTLSLVSSPLPLPPLSISPLLSILFPRLSPQAPATSLSTLPFPFGVHLPSSYQLPFPLLLSSFITPSPFPFSLSTIYPRTLPSSSRPPPLPFTLTFHR